MTVIRPALACLSGMDQITGATDMTPDSSAPDLQTQLESLFHTVWALEKQWQIEDRIDLAIRLSQPGETRRPRSRPIR